MSKPDAAHQKVLDIAKATPRPTINGKPVTYVKPSPPQPPPKRAA